MRNIYDIARAELQSLFYSPIAWLILIIFTFQSAGIFGGHLAGMVMGKELGYSLSDLTYKLFVDQWSGGIFPVIQGYLYLYIPLLTMGVMSRELSSGSIKLLYSSPVTNRQIIFGKYLSMMIYGLVMMFVLLIYIVVAWCSIKDFDSPMVFTGLLGLYLLLCVYAAVGLFMSSLTSYQVVAAMLTLTILGVLNYVGSMWQDVEFVREITYWLSISGRANEFIRGLICSEDLLYFIIVTAMFLTLATIRLQAARQKQRWTKTSGQYLGVIMVIVVLGYFTSRPSLMTYYDATATKRNTLTERSQEVISQLKGGLTITTYVNLLDDNNIYWGVPSAYKSDQQNFRHYTRFKPEIEMKYVYYYDTLLGVEPSRYMQTKSLKERAHEAMTIYGLDSTKVLTPEQIRAKIDLVREDNWFVRVLERESGEKTFLRIFRGMDRMPKEAEITAAMKRLAMKLPIVGVVTGHGERNIHQTGDRNYTAFGEDRHFRYALMNQGFDVKEVSLDNEIPEEINILLLAEMRSPFTPEQRVNWEKYVARGGNLIILSEPNRRDVMGPVLADFGVQMVPGILVKPTKDFAPELIQTLPTREACEQIYYFGAILDQGYCVTMPSASALTYGEDKGFKLTPLFETDSLVWNELQTTDFVDDSVSLDVASGEVQQKYITSVALTRQVGEREQRIIILGDADCISNGELSMGRAGIRSANYTLIMGGFYWLSDGEVPIDVRRPALLDDDYKVGGSLVRFWDIFLSWILPCLMLVAAVFILLRRRGR